MDNYQSSSKQEKTTCLLLQGISSFLIADVGSKTKIYIEAYICGIFYAQIPRQLSLPLLRHIPDSQA